MFLGHKVCLTGPVLLSCPWCWSIHITAAASTCYWRTWRSRVSIQDGRQGSGAACHSNWRTGGYQSTAANTAPVLRGGKAVVYIYIYVRSSISERFTFEKIVGQCEFYYNVCTKWNLLRSGYDNLTNCICEIRIFQTCMHAMSHV